MPRKRITVLLYPSEEPGLRVAHCLEYDIVGVGETDAEATEELVGTIRAHVELLAEHGDVRAPKPAPKAFWDALEHAQEVSETNLAAPGTAALPGVCKRFTLEAAPSLA